jgi:hypothetical protein
MSSGKHFKDWADEAPIYSIPFSFIGVIFKLRYSQ